MHRISMDKPLKAKAVYLKGKQHPLRDRIIWLYGNFLLVAKDSEDTAPTWYNVDRVDRLEGVEEIPNQKQQRTIIW